MFALGCIQAQTCHSGNCPTGVATQDPLRQRALDVGDKSDRVWRYHQNTLQALKELLQAAGLDHPGQLNAAHLMRRMESGEVRSLAELHDFLAPGSLLRALEGSAEWPAGPYRMHWPRQADRPVTSG